MAIHYVLERLGSEAHGVADLASTRTWLAAAASAGSDAALWSQSPCAWPVPCQLESWRTAPGCAEHVPAASQGMEKGQPRAPVSMASACAFYLRHLPIHDLSTCKLHRFRLQSEPRARSSAFRPHLSELHTQLALHAPKLLGLEGPSLFHVSHHEPLGPNSLRSPAHECLVLLQRRAPSQKLFLPPAQHAIARLQSSVHLPLERLDLQLRAVEAFAYLGQLFSLIERA